MMMIHRHANIRLFVVIFVLVAISISCSLLQSSSAFTFSSTTIATTKLFGKVVRNNNNDDDNAEQRQQKIPEPGAEAAPSARYVQELIKAFKAEQEAKFAEQEAKFAKEREKTNEQETKNAEQMEALKAELKEVREKTKEREQEAKLEALKAELKEVREKTKEQEKKTNTELTILKDRLDNIVGAYYPATQYALFETFIFCFVQLESNDDDLKFKMTHFCRSVIRILLSSQLPAESEQGSKGKLRLSFPTGNWKELTEEVKKRQVLRALQGLEQYTAYVNASQFNEIINAKKRNELSHNGGLLCAFFPFLSDLFPFLQGERETHHYDETSVDVRDCIKNYIEPKVKPGSNDLPYMEIDIAVAALVKDLKEKGLLVNDVPDAEKEVVNRIGRKLKGNSVTSY